MTEAEFLAHLRRLPLHPGELALKFVGSARDAMLALPGAEPLRYEPDQPASKSYVVVPEPLLSDPDELGSWVIRSVSGLPAKRPRKRA